MNCMRNRVSWQHNRNDNHNMKIISRYTLIIRILISFPYVHNLVTYKQMNAWDIGIMVNTFPSLDKFLLSLALKTPLHTLFEIEIFSFLQIRFLEQFEFYQPYGFDWTFSSTSNKNLTRCSWDITTGKYRYIEWKSTNQKIND